MYKYSTILIIFFILIFNTAFSQNKIDTYNSTVKHSFSFVISHTQINEGFNEDGKKQWLSLPSWGINYNYMISTNWSLGLHTDIIVEDFKVEDFTRNNSIIERSYPIASALVASYKPGKHFSYLFGSGAEVAKGENFFLIRLGLEYGLHINHNWEVIANLVNDYKFDAYNSWSIGMGISYKL
jgi:hypothetical protein